MRYKPEQKEETHRRIVEAASREFRAHGFEGIGIAELMHSLGLTHGGFYAHFADKEALVGEATVFALEASLRARLKDFAEGGLARLLDTYLGEYHRDHPEVGCPLPTISAEVARRPPSSRERFTAKLTELLDGFAAGMPGATLESKQQKAKVLLASMVGAISLARAVSDPELSSSILDAAHEHLLAFAAED